ncbi:MAG: arylesterase [Bacteroidetes bacterium QS_8_68_15]|nr:MAG: arylesterase [Bacteroidetes bacterium QS_8_68_15]
MLCAALLLSLIAAAGVVGCRSGETSSGSSSAPPADSSAQAAADAAPNDRRRAAAESLTVVVFGNSLAAGYGLASEDQAFPALLEQKADSAGLPAGDIVAAGNSGETTAGGRRRIDWILRREELDVLVLELGGNDALRGLPPDSARANLRAIIRKTRAEFPDVRVVLTGMKAPPNMGSAYRNRFARIYPQLAEETGAALVPFLLKGVGGRPALNQPDGIHPNAEGHRRLAANVWTVLEPLLREMRRAQDSGDGRPTADGSVSTASGAFAQQ